MIGVSTLKNAAIAFVIAIVAMWAAYVVLHDFVHPFGFGDDKGKARAAAASATVAQGTVQAAAGAAKIVEAGHDRDATIEKIRVTNYVKVQAAITDNTPIPPSVSSAFVNGLCDFPVYAADPACGEVRPVHP